MKIGYAQNTITPSLDPPVFLAGFGNNRRAQTIHDELYARALAIQAGDNTLVLVALDIIGLFRQDVYDVIETLKIPDIYRISRLDILIASTHTHHGPDTMGLWGSDQKTCGVDFEYMSILKERIAKTIVTSLSDLKPASAKWTSVHVPGFVRNHRNPDIIDDELTLAQFIDEHGKPLATFANFPCHPEVLWDENPQITSDYPGYLRNEVEEKTGAPCIFFAGALGGMLSPDFPDDQRTFENAEKMGRTLAKAGLNALQKVRDQSSTVSMKKKVFKSKLTNILYKFAFVRKLLPDTRDPKGYITTEVNLIKVGDLWLVTVPGELLPKLGLNLKAQLLEAGAKVVGVIGLANDELGYILPAEDFKYPWNPFNPGKNYEETNSIGKHIGHNVMNALKEIIQ